MLCVRLPAAVVALRLARLEPGCLQLLGHVCDAFNNNYLTLYLATEADVPLTTASAYTSIIYGLNMTGKVREISARPHAGASA